MRSHWPNLYSGTLAMSPVTAVATWSSVTASLWISITKCQLPWFSVLPKCHKAAHAVCLLCFSPFLLTSPADDGGYYLLPHAPLFGKQKLVGRSSQSSYLGTLRLNYSCFILHPSPPLDTPAPQGAGSVWSKYNIIPYLEPASFSAHALLLNLAQI